MRRNISDCSGPKKGKNLKEKKNNKKRVNHKKKWSKGNATTRNTTASFDGDFICLANAVNI